MHAIRWSTMIVTLFMLGYFLYQFNEKYAGSETVVYEQIHNLTKKYELKREKMANFYVSKIETLKKELEQMQAEEEYQLSNLEDRYHNQRYYMNTTIYMLNQMYLPEPIQLHLGKIEIPPEVSLKGEFEA